MWKRQKQLEIRLRIECGRGRNNLKLDWELNVEEVETTKSKLKATVEAMGALFGSSSSSPPKGRGEVYRLVSSAASEAMGIGKSSDVLTVLGGKASCRRKFVLNVHLVDEQGNLVSRDLPIVAFVAYAHDHSPVLRDEKPFLVEPPLFTTFNGVEFPAQDRPTRMVSGRASFKLAISLLSSKCDNRLFCICFTPQAAGGGVAPICAPCYSKPIRSISRKRTQSSAHVAPVPPLLLLAGLEASPPTSGMRSYTDKSNTAGTMGNLPATAAGGLGRYNETDASGSSTGGMASVSCSPVSSNPPAKNYCSESMKVTTPPCSLSLRLSPSDSGSPTSGALTSESSYDNKQQQQDPAASRNQSSSLATGSSRPTFNAPNFPQPTDARPFRPYATMGPCKVPMDSDFHLGNGISLATPLTQSLKRSSDGGGAQTSTNTLLERVHQLRAVSPAGRHQEASGTVDSVWHGFSLGTEVRSSNNGDDKFSSAFTEISLEEEEKSLQYIEVSLQEVSREVQRRKEELRSKRRRLLDDEARMHSIIFQSSSWIESLSGRFSL